MSIAFAQEPPFLVIKRFHGLMGLPYTAVEADVPSGPANSLAWRLRAQQGDLITALAVPRLRQL